MTEDVQRYIAQELAYAQDTNHFFSETRKAERERLTCAMLLRALGMPFAVEELVSVPKGQDPPDVTCQGARFEVYEHLDEGRRRHDEVKARVQRLLEATSIDVFWVDRPPAPRPMSYDEVYALLPVVLAEKAARYGVKACATLDTLVCIHLRHRCLRPALPLPEATALRQQGWRSVSFVMSMCSHVVYATEAAPEFLRMYAGQTRRQWEDPVTFFRL